MWEDRPTRRPRADSIEQAAETSGLHRFGLSRRASWENLLSGDVCAAVVTVTANGGKTAIRTWKRRGAHTHRRSEQPKVRTSAEDSGCCKSHADTATKSGPTLQIGLLLRKTPPECPRGRLLNSRDWEPNQGSSEQSGLR